MRYNDICVYRCQNKSHTSERIDLRLGLHLFLHAHCRGYGFRLVYGCRLHKIFIVVFIPMIAPTWKQYYCLITLYGLAQEFFNTETQMYVLHKSTTDRYAAVARSIANRGLNPNVPVCRTVFPDRIVSSTNKFNTLLYIVL